MIGGIGEIKSPTPDVEEVTRAGIKDLRLCTRSFSCHNTGNSCFTCQAIRLKIIEIISDQIQIFRICMAFERLRLTDVHSLFPGGEFHPAEIGRPRFIMPGSVKRLSVVQKPAFHHIIGHCACFLVGIRNFETSARLVSYLSRDN